MSVTAPARFVATGLACGIKPNGDLDLALLATSDRKAVPAAAVFTTNKATAAPVVVSRNHLDSTLGRAAAIVVSSGNANAATGSAGEADAERICGLVGTRLGVAPGEVLICQTGPIGIPLPMPKIEGSIEALVASLGTGPGAAVLAASAMMTTDTFRKEVVVEGQGYRVGAMAKGAAMLAPNLATMLAVLTTDARCEPPELASALRDAVEHTFNRMTVDGCTSTNDTVVALASGGSGVRPSSKELGAAFEDACGSLAAMMAADAEGGTKVARISVRGAACGEDAHLAARRVAESSLVKCSLNGEDPYWGRIVSELGSSGADFDPLKVEVSYGGVTVCRAGVACAHDAGILQQHMKGDVIEIDCDLGLGAASASVLSCDLGYGYIDENRTTS